MDYSQYTVEDFVLDKPFREWVISPDRASNLFWQDWLRMYPEKKLILQEAKATILKIPHIQYGWNQQMEDRLWQTIQNNLAAGETLPEAKRDTSPQVIPLHATAVLEENRQTEVTYFWDYQRVSRWAAMILICFSCGLAAYLGAQENASEPTTIAILEKVTPLGSKLKFALPDGTKIILNAGSKLSYPEQFSSNVRHVSLEGEAYFEVKKDVQRPFRVKTDQLTTEALGTAFNVKMEQEKIEVALIEGKVKVSNQGELHHNDQLILLPGEQATLQKDAVLLKSKFDIDEVTAWKHEIILFKEASEQEVIQSLEKWYGVSIQVDGKAAKPWRFSGRFDHKNLEYVLQSIGYSMAFQFSIDDKNVKITYQ